MTGPRLRPSQGRRPGEKRPGVRAGYVYLHSIVDGYSRLAYTEPLPDERAKTAVGFLRRAMIFFASHGITHVHRVVTDNTVRGFHT